MLRQPLLRTCLSGHGYRRIAAAGIRISGQAAGGKACHPQPNRRPRRTAGATGAAAAREPQAHLHRQAWARSQQARCGQDHHRAFRHPRLPAAGDHRQARPPVGTLRCRRQGGRYVHRFRPRGAGRRPHLTVLPLPHGARTVEWAAWGRRADQRLGARLTPVLLPLVIDAR